MKSISKRYECLRFLKHFPGHFPYTFPVHSSPYCALQYIFWCWVLYSVTVSLGCTWVAWLWYIYFIKHFVDLIVIYYSLSEVYRARFLVCNAKFIVGQQKKNNKNKNWSVKGNISFPCFMCDACRRFFFCVSRLSHSVKMYFVPFYNRFEPRFSNLSKALLEWWRLTKFFHIYTKNRMDNAAGEAKILFYA